jgi:predicted 2-oxoglutarate/Fe(II)-dependent dioxygenase YbiX
MIPSEVRSRISETVMTQINADREFYDRVFPQKSTAVIISKTSIDEGLKIHHDDATVGEFSTTVFLSNPEIYEGGELCLWYEGEVQKFKLPAGYAITYNTGAPHCVAPVTYGNRIAAVFWTTSEIRDPRHREVLSSLRTVRRLLPEKASYDFTETMNDPAFLLLEAENKFIRYFVNGL